MVCRSPAAFSNEAISLRASGLWILPWSNLRFPVMGSYSILNVGRTALAWKYRIPTFATFLFKQSDYYDNDRPRGDPRDPNYDHMGTRGYRSSAEAVKSHLDELGFTLSFWGGVTAEILAESGAYQIELVSEALAEREGNASMTSNELEALARTHIARRPASSPADDVRQFIAYIRDAIDDETDQPSAEGEGSGFRRIGDDCYIDFDDLGRGIRENALEAHPGVLRVSALLEEERFADYPEVADLFFVRCLLEVVDSNAVVHLDLSDLWDEGENFSNLPAELAEQLLRKLQIYTRVFNVLGQNEPEVRRRAARGQARALMDQLDMAPTADTKGRTLEDLSAVIFGSHPDLRIRERRLNLGDQEIDIVVDNHVDHGFWSKLDSPLFLVECKNWSSNVGTPEIRDFETKVRDHQPHARLGILIAVGGFSREAETALARASREPYQLVLAKREDLDVLLDTGFEVLPWLEGLIARFS